MRSVGDRSLSFALGLFHLRLGFSLVGWCSSACSLSRPDHNPHKSPARRGTGAKSSLPLPCPPIQAECSAGVNRRAAEEAALVPPHRGEFAAGKDRSSHSLYDTPCHG